ncbi:vomeronasal type-1 receptor 1-like [Manis pentadactyla]|uniref:vomeronasal type-1 receptor 1-like n=1 Tax=Manis pentadactyla TaxID=143292 RepID=UPI00255C3879|nr:vomeronasal type-1 receptor 1-like [Manis pentadactyla]
MPSQKDGLQTTGNVALKTTFLLQIGFGTLANVTLFFHNVSPALCAHKQRPTHVVLTHMALANLLVLLSSGIPQTMVAFLLTNPLSSLGCKVVYYTHRVARSCTLCCTCVLSTYQFFTLIPGRGDCMTLRRDPKMPGPSCCVCWVFSLLLNIYTPLNVTGALTMGNDTDTQGRWFCSSSSPRAGIGILPSCPDSVFIGLMVWASSSTVGLLRRHHQRVQHIHTHKVPHNCPPETRAAHTILMLVVTFVVFYMMNLVVTFYITVFLDLQLWLIQTCNILALCFPTVSPFLLILRDPRTPRFCS